MSLRTERDHEDPSVTQLAVFLHNRVGQLREVLKCLESAALAVHAVCVSDSSEFAVVRLVVDDLERARQVLKEEGFAASESLALAVELPEGPPGLLGLCRALLQAEVNIHYAYPMIARPHGRAVMVLHVDSLPPATECLRRAGYVLVDELDLKAGP